jgi:hypothetical protein
MSRRSRFLCWSAFILGGLGWAVSSQWGSMRVSDDCTAAQPWQMLLLGLAGLIAAGAGALLSWRGLREAQRPTAVFVARISLAACAAFALAVAFHTLAGLLIPGCAT